MSEVHRGFDGEQVWPYWECPNCDAPNPGAEQCDPANGAIRCDECSSVMVYKSEATLWPAIHAAEYESRCDPLGQNVLAAASLSVDCDDCDLIGSLEDLERLLRGQGYSNEERLEAEESVESSLLVIRHAFEKND
jgi:DNA-directed RNA polymerase subunit RPC12/RpoP